MYPKPKHKEMIQINKNLKNPSVPNDPNRKVDWAYFYSTLLHHKQFLKILSHLPRDWQV